ncbi:helix-turn-helix domain-containing protein [Lederbergia citrea]|uniref:Helix-turn-helix domain-containing protein n=1 Tax=Lederbergia citrea TaxID=2833581 RepID=A0A942ULP3_9BACI|nr:helix-turn-helix domain-containing protein [Lederbergia citrea]MBS4204199.1 helix-turn-helix domain-containing protein [Lederbergia citrea]MBS4221216.1 helix-turn-helix domain-containing protein [Lederbergia citrea]
MINRLTELYPNAIFTATPSLDPHMYWFKENNTEQYMGIPSTDLSPKEINILKTLFTMTAVDESINVSESVRLWRNFFLFDEPVPSFQQNHCRFIHFSISNMREQFQFDEWEEAVKSLFPHEISIVPFSGYDGVIVEDQRELQMDEDELFSAIQAFESDFFFKVHFFIGRFHSPDDKLKQLFTLEKSIFQLSLDEQSEDRIFTLEKLMPSYVFRSIPKCDRNILFGDIHNLLVEDHDLSETIKRYIENQSNATLTAKQLFMHRNSLQYRIDKFIEKTGIDIKTFHGAFFAYLGCLYNHEED